MRLQSILVTTLFKEDTSGICKIDTEDFELKILHGMCAFIHSHERIKYCVEITNEFLKSSGGSSCKLFAFFKQFRFFPYGILASGSLKPLTSPAENLQYNAFLFARM